MTSLLCSWGNKIDQASERREVSAEEAMKKASECNVLFTEVSAKCGTNIKHMFRQVAAALPAPAVTGGGADANDAVPSPARSAGGSGMTASGVGTGQFGCVVRPPFLITPSAMQAASNGTADAGGAGGADIDAQGGRSGACC
ncbi:hypothetical protein LSCM4_03439 [Leishmania orientalis]|uniref:Uncharacterized protein n=1 Tax=Leishmania orientalis TaxID=2249476 RepID=A0A836KGM2_9TRYP|nr:hypothetical protein LSCM4_03439 [Leishmania orientalis]